MRCTIMHDAFRRRHKGIANKRDPGTAHLLSFCSRRDTTFFLIFKRWKGFIVLQSIFTSGNMCQCILVDKNVHDRHNQRTALDKCQAEHHARLCKLAKLCITFFWFRPR